MAENTNDQKRKENIQQNPDHVDDQKKQPVTPEPPQKKDPNAKPVSDSGKGKK